MNPQLLDYVKQQLAQGVTKEIIQHNLISQGGWTLTDITAVFTALGMNNPTPVPVAPIIAPATPAPASTPIPPTMNVAPAGFSGMNNPVSVRVAPMSAPVQMSPQTKTSLPGAFAILGQALSLYKKRFWVVLGILIIPVVLNLLSATIENFANGLIGSGTNTTTFITGAALVIGGLLISLISLWGYIALVNAIKGTEEGIGVMGSYRRASKKIVSFIWVSILVFCVISGGFLLLIIPGLVFMLLFVFAPFVLIDEDIKGLNALLKSQEYVEDYWGAVFWRFFFLGLVHLILFVIPFFAIVLFAPTTILPLLELPSVSILFGVIGGLFLTPISIIYYFLVYNNLKAVKGEFVFDPNKRRKTFISIAILGGFLIPILMMSAVVLAALNSARDKGADAAIKAHLNVMIPEAELYYLDTNNNSYAGVCDTPGSQYGLADRIASVATSTGSVVSCFDSKTLWVASAPLKTDSKINFCVDSSGYINNGIADSATFSCKPDMGITATSSSDTVQGGQSQLITNLAYSYSLPTGWQKATSSSGNSQAFNEMNNFRLLVASKAFPASAGKITSIDEVETIKDANDLIQIQFPGGVLKNAEIAMIGGEKAVMSTFTYLPNGAQQSESLFILKYDTVNEGIFYNIILTSPNSKSDSTSTDFQSIVNSFKFKTITTTNSSAKSTPVKSTQTTQPVQTASTMYLYKPVAGQNITLNKEFAVEFSTSKLNSYYYIFFLVPKNVPADPQSNTSTYFNKIANGYSIGGFRFNAPTDRFNSSAIIPNGIPFGTYKLRIYQFDYNYHDGGSDTVLNALSFVDSPYFMVSN